MTLRDPLGRSAILAQQKHLPKAACLHSLPQPISFTPSLFETRRCPATLKARSLQVAAAKIVLQVLGTVGETPFRTACAVRHEGGSFKRGRGRGENSRGVRPGERKACLKMSFGAEYEIVPCLIPFCLPLKSSFHVLSVVARASFKGLAVWANGHL